MQLPGSGSRIIPTTACLALSVSDGAWALKAWSSLRLRISMAQHE